VGFLDLDADTSNLPERVPEGFFRKEKPPEGVLPALWWNIKRRPVIAISVFVLPLVIFGTFLFVRYMTESAPVPVPEAGKKTEGADSKSTDLIQINIKENNPSDNPEFKAPRKPIVPIAPAGGAGQNSGKDD
jgi:hypothetical protein